MRAPALDAGPGPGPRTWQWRRPPRGPAPLIYSGLLRNRIQASYGPRTPGTALHSWFSFTVPTIGPKPLEKPVRLLTNSCGRGTSVGLPFPGYDSTNGCEKLVFEPLITGAYPWNRAVGSSDRNALSDAADPRVTT